ncbi:metal-dependent hydrolase [Acinetobacter nematophilus]|uniref:Metal-dependent hydrolase n=1 Tax=Acinetobacter nematophilus TaxID=2994642 RepID=A0A9X3IIA3_9GAMM|nr:metal-dependent hydrolase [Acinetobacter nematophilus]MCX5468099.1 metal-dependent hydrolase [Acinetobacter nematophilus]
MSILAKVFDRGANFPVRHMNFNFEQAQHPLFRDNPWGEYWLATLSAMFPAGERFFVHSVRNLQHQAKADHLKKDIAAFIGQEAMHAKEHELLNELIQRSGLDTTPTSVNVEWLMAKLKKFLLQCNNWQLLQPQNILLQSLPVKLCNVQICRNVYLSMKN